MYGRVGLRRDLVVQVLAVDLGRRLRELFHVVQPGQNPFGAIVVAFALVGATQRRELRRLRQAALAFALARLGRLPQGVDVVQHLVALRHRRRPRERQIAQLLLAPMARQRGAGAFDDRAALIVIGVLTVVVVVVAIGLRQVDRRNAAFRGDRRRAVTRTHRFVGRRARGGRAVFAAVAQPLRGNRPRHSATRRTPVVALFEQRVQFAGRVVVQIVHRFRPFHQHDGAVLAAMTLGRTRRRRVVVRRRPRGVHLDDGQRRRRLFRRLLHLLNQAAQAEDERRLRLGRQRG